MKSNLIEQLFDPVGARAIVSNENEQHNARSLTVHRRVKRIKGRLRKKSRAFVRQGEWLFVPTNSLTIDKKLVIRNERLGQATFATPYKCQFLYRNVGAGRTIYVRGRVAGADQQAIVLHDWHRVLMKH